MKKILGLDLGTNSIGWSLIAQNYENKQGNILGLGSRIIPMSQDILGEFDKGNSVSQTAKRTGYRSVRRLRERNLLRRERLHRVLNVLGFLPQHYAEQIDFERHVGQFFNGKEPKLAWRINEKGKHTFIFQNSFNEMVDDFRSNKQDIKIPYDWTIYYLRKKALTKKIEQEELAWLILNFNQKRGYYQLRGEEEEETPNKLVEFHTLKVIDVVADEGPDKKGETWFSLHLENGWIYRRSTKTSLADWKDKVRDFIVTTELNDDGTIKKDKEGNERRSFRAPGEDDWTLIKKKTEQEIDNARKTVGTYIYDTLLQKPNQQIRGKLVRTIERKFYKDELHAILNVQKQFHPELQNEDLYNDCVRELYRSNEAQQMILSKKDFVHLFLEDIIFYQRPLRSQKSSIGNCSLEYRIYKDGSGSTKTEYLKAIPKSHPLYQEFRIWQWLYNLKIYQKDDDNDVTLQFIAGIEDQEKVFNFLINRKEIEQKSLLKCFLEDKGFKGKTLNTEIERYRWNYVEDKTYPCNETGTQIRTRLARVENVPDAFLTPVIEQQLWHIIYSVKDKIEFEKALKSFADKHDLDDISFLENFKKFPPFKSEYGAYSEKAIKKLLPLMRLGKYWNVEAIDAKTKERIDKILTGEYDEEIKDRVREKAIHLTEQNHFQGLQLWLAQYIIYGRHSEAPLAGKWNSVEDLEGYLQDFKQHSLRNPIVEQVVTETLRVVKDIWSKYGNGAKDFFNEIHIELGREMKNRAEDRKRITNQVSVNENTNLRIKALITELKDNSDGKLLVEDVRPYSPIQQEALRIYEEDVLNSNMEIPTDILIISKTAQPTKSELQRYKLWLEQKYRSPYTGKMIPLNKLFTEAYQIEHIIPQARYFDDSITNKVICEAAVNQKKDKQLGFEFIRNHHGEKIETGRGQTVEIFSVEAYQQFVKDHYGNNRPKRNKLLLEEIPDKMIERQLNDTRYISKFISNLLSNIVRSDSDDDGVNSKNVLPGNGKVTSILRQDWGLDSVWNDLILPRFERMNQLTGSTVFTFWNEQYQKYLPTVPLELSKGFQKKRIDHRHHAIDALVIACATHDHVNLLNNQHAKSETLRYDLQNKLRNKEKWTGDDGRERDKFTEFKKPWNSFTADARNELEKITVSFKQSLRVINKATNHYEKYGPDGDKVFEEQKGTNWAIRKALHKDTVFAKVSLRKIKKINLKEALNNWKMLVDKQLKKEIKRLIALYEGKFDADKINKYFKDNKYQFREVDVSKVEIYYFETENVAVRKPLDPSFTESKIKESVTDSGIQKILLNHLAAKVNKPDLAFSHEGIEEMNKNIVQLNDGKTHQPILKVRVYETIGNKFQVGQTGNKKDKYVEAAKGTNLFFAVYADENGSRSYETIPLNIVIERLKQGWNAVPERNEKGHNLLFHLSPDDLVYVPTKEQLTNNGRLTEGDIISDRIYKLTDTSDTMANFIPANVAWVIFNYNKDKQKKMGIYYPVQNEIGVGSQGSKSENAITGEQIKKVCIKLNIDRLGNIKPASL